MLLTSEGKDFEQPPVGNHISRCYYVVDIGTQKGEYKGVPNAARKIIVRWELCSEFMTEGEMAGKPFSVGKIYTASLGEKANLRHDLESWRGRAFTPEELKGFDSKKMLGTACMVNVGRTDKGKAKVLSVSVMPKGVTAPAQANESVYFSLDSFDGATYESLSKWAKEQIAQSPEYERLFESVPDATDDAKNVDPGSFADLDDDIPFN